MHNPEESILTHNIGTKNEKASILMLGAFLLLFLSAAYPLSFGKVAHVSDFLWIEGLAPIMFACTCLCLIKDKHSFLPYGSRFASLTLFGFLLIAIVHYIYNPVSSQNLLSAGKYKGGIRAYYSILIGFCIFFSCLWLACYWTKQKTFFRKFLSFILWISLFIGYARLVTYLLGVELPLLKGVFDYSELARIGKAHRIGGLSETATLGISALMALQYRKKWNPQFIIVLCLSLFLMVMSGGRSSSIGLLAAFYFYFIMINKKIGPLILFTILLAILMLIFLQFEIFQTQFGRITNIGHGLKVDAPGRYSLFLFQKKIIMSHPFFGKGIGVKYLNKNIPPFVFNQLVGGGHGSYLSILTIFGLYGLTFLITILFGTIVRGIFFIYREYRSSILSKGDSAMICFIVFELIIMSFEFLAGGNGYSNLKVYLLAGIATGLFSKREYEV